MMKHCMKVSKENAMKRWDCLTLIGTDYNMVLVCADETECDNIIDELTDQGIGKRI